MPNTTKVSKFLSWALRHNPKEAGISLDENGWASIDDVMAVLQREFGQIDLGDLYEVVETNNKKRFVIDGDRIRANQGHSIAIDLQLTPVTPPPILYHGTKRNVLDKIMTEGLIPGSRQHVHLSADTATAKIVAARRKGDSVILTVLTETMTQPFYLSENGVWLTGVVAPEFIRT